MSIMTKSEFEKLAKKDYNTIPLIYPTEKWADVTEIYETFDELKEDRGLLESGRAGRYSYISFSQIAQIEAKNGKVKRVGKGMKNPAAFQGDPIEELKDLMHQWKAPRLPGPDWQGGAVGYLSYDMARYFENLPDRANDDLKLPDLMFTVYRDLIVLDHQTNSSYLITNVLLKFGDSYEAGKERLEKLKEKFHSLSSASPAVVFHELKERRLKISPSFTKKKFEEAVRRVQDYIRSGDVFQVNLSVRQDFPLESTPWEIYKTLRQVNPSPYMGFLQYPEFQIVSGSPELLIKIKDRKISTRPIAGTRPRGKDREEDLRLAKELIENEKERAEHIMLVDLERNDLGRVCQFGTVKVTDLMVIEEYSHVMHIVSHVEGVLSETCDGYQAIRACFPGGTITGAPKIRTMEIIEELEPVKRGIYTGSIGWIGFQGDMELNIVIRTLLAKGGVGYVQAGAGIVIDSKPEAEYHESLKKAEALLKSVELSKEMEKLSRA